MQAFRMKADGSEQTQMTFDSEWNTWFPHISPDRKLVSMICYRKGDVEPGEHVPHKNVQIRVMRSDGSDLHTVVELFGGQGTINVNSWSPDSRKFAFVSYRIVTIHGLKPNKQHLGIHGLRKVSKS
jgi:Tol biopolymer transport system component